MKSDPPQTEYSHGSGSDACSDSPRCIISSFLGGQSFLCGIGTSSDWFINLGRCFNHSVVSVLFCCHKLPLLRTPGKLGIPGPRWQHAPGRLGPGGKNFFSFLTGGKWIARAYQAYSSWAQLLQSHCNRGLQYRAQSVPLFHWPEGEEN